MKNNPEIIQRFEAHFLEACDIMGIQLQSLKIEISEELLLENKLAEIRMEGAADMVSLRISLTIMPEHEKMIAYHEAAHLLLYQYSSTADIIIRNLAVGLQAVLENAEETTTDKLASILGKVKLIEE